MANKSNVLVIRKPDGTSHQAPLDQRAFLTSLNKRQPQDKKWTIEEMSQEEANQIPVFDPAIKGASLTKMSDLSKEVAAKDALLSEKDAQIQELLSKLNSSEKALEDLSKLPPKKMEAVNEKAEKDKSSGQPPVIAPDNSEKTPEAGAPKKADDKAGPVEVPKVSRASQGGK